MRVSIPPGTVIAGRKTEYIVDKVVSISDRSTTLLCFDNQKHKFRLKIFDGNSSITSSSFAFFNEVKSPCLEELFDYGSYSGYSFFVFFDYNVRSLDEQYVPIDLLVKQIIPKLAYVINQIHQKRYLIRDIDTKHILFDPKTERILYIGLSNFVKLQDKTTATKEKGYGQHYTYLAPEVGQYGYSFASDYFSLGVFLLYLLTGNELKKVSKDEYLKAVKKGDIPRVDITHITNTSPELFSSEDKVYYLIMGLMLPNPQQRWGADELSCWCNNQMIPLVSRGAKIKYQYSSPLIIGNKECWNDEQIGKCLASSARYWTNDTYYKVRDYLRAQKSEKSSQLDRFSNDDDEKTRVFKTIYTLYPQIDGWIWRGKKYVDTYELIGAVKNNSLSIKELQAMLKNGCFSFFYASRSKLGISPPNDIQRVKELEELERITPGDGASRCLVLFMPNTQARYFEIEGKRYESIVSFLSAYKGNGIRLKENSYQILNNKSFQAWLWSKGYGTMGKNALESANANRQNSFVLLLSALEACAENEEQKKKIRKVYLKYGDLAPITWLIKKIDSYKKNTQSKNSLYDRFKNARIDLNKSILELNKYLSGYVQDYQQFVLSTLDNPFVLEFGSDDNVLYDFYPEFESYYFCELWNGSLEVCPAFLFWVGGKLDEQRIKSWLSKYAEVQRNILSGKTDRADVRDISDSANYMMNCKRNYNSALAMLIVSTIYFFVTLYYSVGYAFWGYCLAVVFPVMALILYHKKKVRAEIWYRTYKQQADFVSSINVSIRSLSDRENEIFYRLRRGENVKCMIKSTKDVIDNNNNLSAPESLELNACYKIFAYVSVFGLVLMATVFLENALFSVLVASLFTAVYSIGIPLLSKKKLINSCSEWTMITNFIADTSMIGGLLFGAVFITSVFWFTVVVLAVIVVFILVILFA